MFDFLKIKSINSYFTHEPVAVVYLFGSQATGKIHPKSDYDFGVVFLENINKKDRFNKRLEYMGFLGKIVGNDNVEVIDLNQSPVFLQYSAIAPRNDINIKEDKDRIAFEHRTLSNYFDRFYYLRRHTTNSLATTAREGLAI